MADSQYNLEIGRRYVEELWNAQRLDIANEIIGSNGLGSMTPDNAKSMVAGVSTVLSGMERTAHALIANESHIVINSTLSGVHGGSWGPINYPPTGEEMAISGFAVMEVQGDKIVDEPWSNWNLAAEDQHSAANAIGKQMAAAGVRCLVRDGWNGENPSAIGDRLAPDASLVSPWSDGEVRGRDAVVGWFSRFRETNISARFDSDVHTNHDTGTTVFRTWTLTGASGPTSGLAMTRFQNGLIVEERVCV